MGIALDEHNWIVYVIAEHCSKGCLQDILEKIEFKMDWSFKFAFMKDIAEGLFHLHASPIVSHGYLTSYNCSIDGRFVVRISDCGLAKLRNPTERQPFAEVAENQSIDLGYLQWRTPELLRTTMSANGTQRADIYSFSILMQQIILRSSPFCQANVHDQRTRQETKELLSEVAKGIVPPTRPPVSRSACSPELYQLMEDCWSEAPLERPSAAKVRTTLKKISGRSSDNVIDLLLLRMESYSKELESQVTEKAQLLQDEKRLVEGLMKQLMPRHIADSLSSGRLEKPHYHEHVSVCCAKLTTDLTSAMDPQGASTAIGALSRVVSAFDAILDIKQTCVRINGYPESLMLVAGLTSPSVVPAEGLLQILRLAEDLESTLRNLTGTEKCRFRLQAGVHTGPVMSGLLETQVPKYCVLGETVVSAFRLMDEAGGRWLTLMDLRR
ncbi:hypothetical protein RvY_13389-2 [Ramazzottius varieornatus]|uniref:guanylate cyclase n=1 Tax=Ramazzottius varieornatus TaxID=947166 RepID=A0A1D1VMP1_RAMVA|nr:hypothetical protein RvY_13389-2 [Ramazzottius varieornatus]